MTRTRTATALIIALGAVAVIDFLIHLAVNDLEPLRVTGNAVILLASVVILVVPRAARSWVALLAGGVNLALNVVFIGLEGIGPLGVVLILVTTVLAVLAAASLRRR
jgi:hypothetical protein